MDNNEIKAKLREFAKRHPELFREEVLVSRQVVGYGRGVTSEIPVVAVTMSWRSFCLMMKK